MSRRALPSDLRPIGGEARSGSIEVTVCHQEFKQLEEGEKEKNAELGMVRFDSGGLHRFTAMGAAVLWRTDLNVE
jgi:hypothetical protein